jgi:DNA-binding beta-propeller fold protein YncE
VFTGAPLVDPVGLVVSAGGTRLFVADPGANRILVVPVNGANPTTLRGSAGTMPRGLELRVRGGQQRIVFTGTNPADGRPAVFALDARGATRATVIANGRPLRRPQGVAIASDGSVFVSDRGSGRDDGRIFRIKGGRIAVIASGIRLGNPAGIALTRDGSTLLMSSLDRVAGTAQVLLIDMTTYARSVFNDVIGANTTAGGLHRGLRSAVMAWADVQRPGHIYRVNP